MLCLSRKPHERIIIRTPEGVEIVIVVVESNHQRAKLGFVAPHGVTINREEIQQAKDAERRNGAFYKPDDGEDSRA